MLTRSQIAPNTFSRLVMHYELLKPDQDCSNKLRPAFAKAHANEMWQADTLIGPYLPNAGSAAQSRLIAFLDDASRVCARSQERVVVRTVGTGYLNVHQFACHQQSD